MLRPPIRRAQGELVGGDEVKRRGHARTQKPSGPQSPSFDWKTELDFLALLGESNRERLLHGARRLARGAGSVRQYPAGAFAADLIDDGLVRFYQVSREGREATLGYGHPGECIGALAPLAPPIPIVYVQAVLPTTVRRLDSQLFREMCLSDVEVTLAVAHHTARILASVIRVVTVRTLGGVAERVAFDLLERASNEQLRSGTLVVKATHQELAASVGVARESVSRLLGELRAAGMIDAPSHGYVEVRDPTALLEVVYGLVT